MSQREEIIRRVLDYARRNQAGLAMQAAGANPQGPVETMPEPAEITPPAQPLAESPKYDQNVSSQTAAPAATALVEPGEEGPPPEPFQVPESAYSYQVPGPDQGPPTPQPAQTTSEAPQPTPAAAPAEPAAPVAAPAQPPAAPQVDLGTSERDPIPQSALPQAPEPAEHEAQAPPEIFDALQGLDPELISQLKRAATRRMSVGEAVALGLLMGTNPQVGMALLQAREGEKRDARQLLLQLHSQVGAERRQAQREDFQLKKQELANQAGIAAADERSQREFIRQLQQTGRQYGVAVRPPSPEVLKDPALRDAFIDTEMARVQDAIDHRAKAEGLRAVLPKVYQIAEAGGFGNEAALRNYMIASVPNADGSELESLVQTLGVDVKALSDMSRAQFNLKTETERAKMRYQETLITGARTASEVAARGLQLRERGMVLQGLQAMEAKRIELLKVKEEIERDLPYLQKFDPRMYNQRVAQVANIDLEMAGLGARYNQYLTDFTAMDESPVEFQARLVEQTVRQNFNLPPDFPSEQIPAFLEKNKNTPQGRQYYTWVLTQIGDAYPDLSTSDLKDSLKLAEYGFFLSEVPQAPAPTAAPPVGSGSR